MEAYKVGITIALTNQISRGLMLIQGDLARTDARAKQLHATLKEIKLLGIGGAIVGGTGLAGMHALGKTLEAAKEYQQALAQFKAINLGDAVNKDADKFARGSSVIGASATDLIRTVRDLHTAMGDYGMAKLLAPQIAQMKFANQAVFGGHGMDFSERQLQAMENIVEMRGGFKSPQAFLAQADMMQRVISGTGGMVKPSDYMQFIQTAGVAGRLLTDENFYYTMEPLIQEMHAGRVGTGTMSAYNNLAQGKSTVRAAREMMKYGLIDPSMVDWNKIGMLKTIHPGALKGTDEFASNPFGWLKDVLLPALAAKGVTSPREVDAAIASMFGNRTGSNIFSLMFHQIEKIEKNMAISKNAMGTDELVKLARSSPQGAEIALGKAWKTLDAAIGQSLYPLIIPAMNKLAEAIRWLGQQAYRHPRIFDWLIYGFAGLSSALLFSGAVLTLKAAFLGVKLLMPTLAAQITGSVIPALTGMTAVLGPLAAIAVAIANADKIGEATDAIGGSKYNPLNWLQSGVEGAVNSFRAPPSGKNQTVHAKLYLDGRPIAASTSKYLTDDANRPSSSGSGFDGRRGIIQPSWGW